MTSTNDRIVSVDFSRLRRTTTGVEGWKADTPARNRASAFNTAERRGLSARDIQATGRIVRTMARFEVDCISQRVVKFGFVSYNASGQVVTSFDSDYPEWQYVVPNSVGEGVLLAVCEWRNPPQVSSLYDETYRQLPALPSATSWSCPPAPAGSQGSFWETQPELIGGIEALQTGIVYPNFERRSGVEGRVIVRFIVGTGGVPSNLEVVRGVSPGLDAAAVAAVQIARFNPGCQLGQPVPVRFTLPVTFRITSR